MALYDRLMMISDDDGTFTAAALETISGGFVVCATGIGADAVTGSGVGSFAWNDIKVCTVESAADDETAANTVVGLALNTATSGTEIGIISRGIFILEASSNVVTAGYPITSAGSCNYFESEAREKTGSETLIVGRALTSASAEEKYFVGRLHF